ncbi:sigma-70 family RNA polymerase sigma factor [Membranihabitans maritimus]|uniref:sigma-70 family RNA polymerase sigma factor n=1 Tax=Membranihabitans maritimus TaxID=2904244 RepID=UPI001F016164|nr:sigma-70 family RNA polymerase sigma factor [Membranihabitans maritimus]
MRSILGIPEKQRLESLKAGDESAFTAIYNEYWERLYVIAYRKFKDTNTSEGIVQEVFLQLWRKRSDLEIDNLSAYLSTMTRYAIYRHIAKEKKLKKREEEYGYFRHEKIIHINYENKFLLEMISELATELPERCRLVFTYNKLHDRSIKEIARELKISPKTAEAHLTKALRFIRFRMNKLISLLLVLLTIF